MKSYVKRTGKSSVSPDFYAAMRANPASVRAFLASRLEESAEHPGYHNCPACNKHKLMLGDVAWQCLTGGCHEQHRGDLLGLVQAAGWMTELKEHSGMESTVRAGNAKKRSRGFSTLDEAAAWHAGQPDVAQVVVSKYDESRAVLRVEKHRSKVILPYSLHSGEWKSGRGEGLWPVYQPVPPLAMDTFRWVIICEGEKVADALNACRSAKFVAVCSQGGSGASKGTDWSTLPPLSPGAQYLIWPDADKPGQKYAADVARLVPGADVLNTTGLPDAFDGADLLGAAYRDGEMILGCRQTEGEERVVQFVESHSHPTGASPLGPPATLATIRKVISEREFLWPFFFAKRNLHLIDGKGGVGKSRFLLDVLRRIREQSTWPDATPQAGSPDSKFLWIAADGNYDQLVETADGYGIPDDAIVFPGSVTGPFDFTDLSDSGTLSAIRQRLVDDPAIVAVVIDTTTAALGVIQQTDRTGIAAIAKGLSDVARETNAAILLIGHQNKAGGSAIRHTV